MQGIFLTQTSPRSPVLQGNFSHWTIKEAYFGMLHIKANRLLSLSLSPSHHQFHHIPVYRLKYHLFKWFTDDGLVGYECKFPYFLFFLFLLGGVVVFIFCFLKWLQITFVIFNALYLFISRKNFQILRLVLLHQRIDELIKC